MVGQQMAMGDLMKYQAGLDAMNNALSQQLARRQSFFSGTPQIAQQQNQLGVQRGLQMSGLNLNQAQGLNNYNMQNTGMQNDYNLQHFGALNNDLINRTNMFNNFNQGNFQNNMGLYNAQVNQQQNHAQGMGMLGLGGASLIGQGLGLI